MCVCVCVRVCVILPLSPLANSPSCTHIYHSLSSRAQGEVSIREALRELEMWGAGSSFSLSPYTDSAGKEMSVICDWKELVNQVRCIVTIVTMTAQIMSFSNYLFIQWHNGTCIIIYKWNEGTKVHNPQRLCHVLYMNVQVHSTPARRQ